MGVIVICLTELICEIKLGAGKMDQWLRILSGNHKDTDMDPSTCEITQASFQTPEIPALGGCKKLLLLA